MNRKTCRRYALGHAAPLAPYRQRNYDALYAEDAMLESEVLRVEADAELADVQARAGVRSPVNNHADGHSPSAP